MDADDAPKTEPEAERPPLEACEGVPNWDDEYVDRVSDRLMHNYDLEKEYSVEGEVFTLYGQMALSSKKHFLHPALSLAEHESTEHLFVRRVDRADDRTLDRFVELGERLAEEWIDPDEEHFSTDFTFVAVAPSIPEEIRDRVSGFDGRTLLKYGYHGHYEINLAVVAPESEDLVASENADVATAFRLWDPIEREEPGILDLISRRLQL
ncbi:hypothetical protein CV102_12265 [Natronococcus pandeyae]|uniref:DUF8052 domain-containing protein n=1 Tax=Natronococcus pandeyae TaxID=2055836 RepID=A0A8J8Q375_9EURY|nr:hypothetical protein [Natronococcus pandeyae]TYL38566.1 hypothetical protein CV102_12265 [Natronococcus pandeyae]